MTEISCFNHHNLSDPVTFIFYKYEKYIRICLNNKTIILSLSQLAFYKDLFNYYLISLLVTEDTKKIIVYKYYSENKTYQGIYTMRYWKDIRLLDTYQIIKIEKPKLIKSQEPKRSTSSKKIRKFMRNFELYKNEVIKNPIDIFNEFYMNETQDIYRNYEYEKKIEILLNIRHTFGYDIYSSIRKFL
jgi:hypothetical protein